jgi:hypothetical protein
LQNGKSASIVAMRKNILLGAFLVGLSSSVWLVPRASAQASGSGSIEFVARVTPSGGHSEPVRGLEFYLLSKSLADIRAETEKADPAPDMEHFIDTLELSPELKAWMKKHHSVDLQGTDFTSHLTGDDVVSTPEFFDAYKTLNGGKQSGGYPQPKYKESDKTKNPEKYQLEVKQYLDTMRRFVQKNPDSLSGIDVELADKNPGRQWAHLVADQKLRIEHRALQLAQSVYLAAQTEPGADSHGSFQGLAPGNYWLTTLDTPALAGDVRLRWDLPVTVRPGEPTRVELSNVNAVEAKLEPAR